MNAHKPIPAALSPSSSQSAGAVLPLLAAPAFSSRCPDCNGPFSYRIRDEDTGCSYPVDHGEHYCDGCDAIWSDDALQVSAFDPAAAEQELNDICADIQEGGSWLQHRARFAELNAALSEQAALRREM